MDKFAEAWNTGNTDILDAIVDLQLVQHSSSIYSKDVVSIDSLKKQINYVRKIFSDFHLTVEDEIYNDNKCSIRATWTGTYYSLDYLPLNGKKIEVTAFQFYNMKDGKITDLWHVQNELVEMRQFGYTLKFENT